MWTSCFSRVKLLPKELRPVAISRGIPGWFRKDREMRLAPARDMLRAPPAEFDRYYDALLAALAPRDLFDALGDNAVLLCWEKPGLPCHRRSVAEWLEFHLGVVVPEWGYGRMETGWQEHARYHFWEPEATKRARMAELLKARPDLDVGTAVPARPAERDLFADLQAGPERPGR
jgi:hypothetical protein